MPDTKDNLVIVLRPELTHQEVIRFQEEELISGDFYTGHEHVAGIAVSTQFQVGKSEAFAIGFDGSSSTEERRTIQSKIARSPYVLNVYEDTAPEAVIDKMNP